MNGSPGCGSYVGQIPTTAVRPCHLRPSAWGARQYGVPVPVVGQGPGPKSYQTGAEYLWASSPAGALVAALFNRNDPWAVGRGVGSLGQPRWRASTELSLS